MRRPESYFIGVTKTYVVAISYQGAGFASNARPKRHSCDHKPPLSTPALPPSSPTRSSLLLLDNMETESSGSKLPPTFKLSVVRSSASLDTKQGPALLKQLRSSSGSGPSARCLPTSMGCSGWHRGRSRPPRFACASARSCPAGRSRGATATKKTALARKPPSSRRRRCCSSGAARQPKPTSVCT